MLSAGPARTADEDAYFLAIDARMLGPGAWVFECWGAGSCELRTTEGACRSIWAASRTSRKRSAADATATRLCRGRSGAEDRDAGTPKIHRHRLDPEDLPVVVCRRSGQPMILWIDSRRQWATCHE